MSPIHPWSKLGKQQLGRYAEYLVKMELTLHGLDVYTAEVDDKGIDFIVRKDSQHYYDIQVKSARGLTYVFFPKSKFSPRANLYAAFVHFIGEDQKKLYLIPSIEWLEPNNLLVYREYKGLKSAPEFGINLSKVNLPLLNEFAFDAVVDQLQSE